MSDTIDKQTLDDDMLRFFNRIMDRRAAIPQKSVERGEVTTTITEQAGIPPAPEVPDA